MAYPGQVDLFNENGKLRDEFLPTTIGTGDDGLSAYELALQEGFSGTLQQWLDSLHGRDGMDGSDATVTQQAVEAVLTGEISSHSHAGGGGGLTQAQIFNLL